MKNSLSVIINVYKIAEDTILDDVGIDIYHTAIEYDNTEFAFGYLEEEGSCGVYDIKPMSYDEGTYVESIQVGYATRRQFFNKLENIKRNYLGNSYNIITKNCNHFTNDMIMALFNIELPKKYSSFLKFGEFLRKLISPFF